MVRIDVKTPLDRFRRFIILNTCQSFMPRGYLQDPTIFPEREDEKARIYVEAASKIELNQIRDIKSVKAMDVLGIIYNSKSGNTQLKWRQLRGSLGRVTGEASPNSIVNLLEAGVLTRSFVNRVLHEVREQMAKKEETEHHAEEETVGEVGNQVENPS